MIDPVRPEARRLFLGALQPRDRVLVTGAGGWFGSTIAALLHGSDVPTIFTTQRPRVLSYGQGSIQAVAWDWQSIQEFGPTVAIDCAFILRDFIDSMPLEKYVYDNTVLTSRLLQLAQLASVRTLVSVSSGAAVHPIDAVARGLDPNPYGYLKRQAELALLATALIHGKQVVIARAWSLSGGLVTRPERYAFSNLVLQARAQVIRIGAAHQVWRKYVGVDDFFSVALASAKPLATVINSAGELVEIATLAERVVRVCETKELIERPPNLPGERDDEYYSRDESWERECELLGFRPASLDEQIGNVDTYLRNRQE